MPALWWSALIWIASGMLIAVGLGLLRRERRSADLKLNADRPQEYRLEPGHYADVAISRADETTSAAAPEQVAQPPAAREVPRELPARSGLAALDGLPTARPASLPPVTRVRPVRTSGADWSSDELPGAHAHDDRGGLATIRIVTSAAPQTPPAAAWIPEVPVSPPVPRTESAAERAEVLAALGRSISRIRAEIEGDPITGERSPALLEAWDRVAAPIEDAVTTVNSVLFGVGMTLGAAGDNRWSPRSGGYGCFRRVFIDGASVAWLRTEVAPGGRIMASVRAHKPERSILNGQAMVSGEPLSHARAADMLAETLRPAAEEAARTRRPPASSPSSAPVAAAAKPAVTAEPAKLDATVRASTTAEADASPSSLATKPIIADA